MQELSLLNSAESHAPEYEADREKTTENRKHRRLLTQGEAEILIDHGTSLLQGRILNMTQGGCFVQTLKYVHLPPCARAEIIFVVNGQEISVQAEVRFSTSKAGIGFRFLEAGVAMQAILDTVLSSRGTPRETQPPAPHPPNPSSL